MGRGNVNKVETLFIGAVNMNNNNADWYENVIVDNCRNPKVKFGTGAYCNIISMGKFTKIGIIKPVHEKKSV